MSEKANLLNDLIRDSNADLIFFTETWLSERGDEVKINTMTPPYYQACSFPRLTGSGGGLCILTKKSFVNPKSKRIPEFTSFECSKTEIIINNIKVIFYCIYRPTPSARNGLTPSLFISEFEKFLEIYAIPNVKTVILGDINLHFDVPSETYMKQMINILYVRQLHQFVDKPTHRMGHILDWIITNDLDLLSDLDIVDKALSDHYVITCSMNFPKPVLKKKNNKK